MAKKKKEATSTIIGAEAMEAAIKANPTPELLKAYEQFFGKKLEVELPEAEDEGRITQTQVRSKPLKKAPRKRRRPDDDDDDYDDYDDDDDDYEERTPRRRQSSGERSCVARPFEPPRKLKFTDLKGNAGEEGAELKAASDFDKKVIWHRTPRQRAGFKKVKVRCRKCGITDRVSPSLIPPSKYGKYVCNDCCR